MGVPDPDHVVLTGKGGTIRLQKPDKARLFEKREITVCRLGG